MSSSHAQHVSRPLIAIVDDDPLVRRALRRIASSLGIQAETFSDGRGFIETLERVPSLQPACVVLDLHMPDVNGLEVKQHLDFIRPGTPVIFLTGCMEAHERERALGSGALAVFRKPMSEDMQAFFTVLTAAVKI